MMDTDEESCLHYWIIESPRCPWSLSTCKKCKKIDAFKNSLEFDGWNPTPKNGKVHIDPSVQTKEEFIEQSLQEASKPKSNVYEEKFKIKAVRAAKLHGRTVIRQRYGLAETTLRGWIKRYGGKEHK